MNYHVTQTTERQYGKKEELAELFVMILAWAINKDTLSVNIHTSLHKNVIYGRKLKAMS